MKGYTGINHLALVTKDMERTVRFWRDLLGMRMVLCMGRKGYRQYFFEINERDMIVFFEWPGVEDIPPKDHGVPVKGPFAFDHVSIGVEDLPTLSLIKDTLEANGFWASEIIDHGFIISLYAFDPNEIPIEFSVQVPEADPRKEAVLKDKDPTGVTLEGPDPILGKWSEAKPDPEGHKIYPGEGKEYFKKALS